MMINNYKTISFEISHMTQFKKERFPKGNMSPRLGDGKARRAVQKIVDIKPYNAKSSNDGYEERFTQVKDKVF